MSRTVNLKIEHLTRVEGHGNIVIDVDKGELKEARLDIVEAPRMFESMLKGGNVFEAQHITSRICGICACGHSLASIQASEAAIGVTASPQTDKLRKILLHMENLDSHILHLYMLALPDLMNAKSFMELIKVNEEAVRRALRMKKTCNTVCESLVGRHVHPISCVIGGFTKLPGKKTLAEMRKNIEEVRHDLEPTLELFSSLSFPEFQRDTEYVALVSGGDEYPLLHGDIGSTDAEPVSKDDYERITNEFIVKHSSAKHTKHMRSSYMVGALARYKLNHEKLSNSARNAAAKMGLKPDTSNPYLNTAAQLAECFHCCDDALRLIDELENTGIDQSEVIQPGMNETNKINVTAGCGVGAVEVPRGLLFHRYDVDDKGVILNADCVIPTGQNLANIEADMQKLVPQVIDKSEDEIRLSLEMLVRAYDPCISCSAHFLEVEFVKK